MELLRLTVFNFRNLAEQTVSFGLGLNLVSGGNGEGKSSVLEAVTILGSLRSFRAANMRTVVRHGRTAFRLEGELRGAQGRSLLHQVVECGPPLRRSLAISGSVVEAATYLQQLPVFALTGSDRELVVGPPRLRRTLLDRFAFLLEPAHFDDLRTYRRVLGQRNAVLETPAGEAEMVLWEEQLARSAAAVVVRRRRAVKRLSNAFVETYERLRGSGFPEVEIDSREERELRDRGAQELVEAYQKRYAETRERDRSLGFTGIGPHRHDLRLRAAGRPARDVLSGGQTKVVAAALRLAALEQVEQQRGEQLPVVVDDVDAELDDQVLGKLIGCLDGGRQVFCSSARRGILTSMRRVHHLVVKAGACAPGSDGGES